MLFSIPYPLMMSQPSAANSNFNETYRTLNRFANHRCQHGNVDANRVMFKLIACVFLQIFLNLNEIQLLQLNTRPPPIDFSTFRHVLTVIRYYF